MSPSEVSQPRRRTAHLVAAAVTLVEALVLLGFVGFYAYEISNGATDDPVRAATSGALILVFAVLLAALASAWRRSADWARTPTLLWNALLLPVAWSLLGSGRTIVALGVGTLALVGLGAALASPQRQAVRGEADEAEEPDVS